MILSRVCCKYGKKDQEHDPRTEQVSVGLLGSVHCGAVQGADPALNINCPLN